MDLPPHHANHSRNWFKRHPVLTSILTPIIPGVIVGVLVLSVEYEWFTNARDAPTETRSVVATTAATTTAATTTAGSATGESTSDVAPSSPPTTTAHPRSGKSVVLEPVEGFDLDTGVKGGQNESGMDISPSRSGAQINGMSDGKPKLARVSGSAPTGATTGC